MIKRAPAKKVQTKKKNKTCQSKAESSLHNFNGRCSNDNLKTVGCSVVRENSTKESIILNMSTKPKFVNGEPSFICAF